MLAEAAKQVLEGHAVYDGGFNRVSCHTDRLPRSACSQHSKAQKLLHPILHASFILPLQQLLCPVLDTSPRSCALPDARSACSAKSPAAAQAGLFHPPGPVRALQRRAQLGLHHPLHRPPARSTHVPGPASGLWARTSGELRVPPGEFRGSPGGFWRSPGRPKTPRLPGHRPAAPAPVERDPQHGLHRCLAALLLLSSPQVKGDWDDPCWTGAACSRADRPRHGTTCPCSRQCRRS